MAKLLIIAPQNPYPAIDGGKSSIYHPLIYLAQYFQVHFVFTYFQPLPQNITEHFANFGIKIYPQKVNTKDSIKGILLNLFSGRPYKFQKYHNRSVLERIKEIVQKEGIDLIWCNHSHMAWYGLELQKFASVKIFLREHNVEYSLVEQVMQIKKAGLIKLFVRWQYLKTKRYEIYCWSKFDKTFFISDSDFTFSKEDCPGCKNVYLLYDGFLKKEKKPESLKKEREEFSFIFTGSVSTFQNCYNLQRFIQEVWTPLIKVDSRWKLYITGNSQEILKKKIGRNLSEKRIINLGFVKNLENVIDSKKYFISPTYIGSGLRIKVLNAMSLGAVCFLTPLDAGMLSAFKDFVNIIKFDDFNIFYKNLIRLENSESLYNSISLQAVRAGADFGWKDYAIKVYNEITRV